MACATVNFPNTKQGKYAASLSFFNDTVEAYYNVLILQDEATKVKWKEKINPRIKDTGVALSLWGQTLNEPAGISNEVEYLRLLQDMLIVLVELNIIKIGG
jgi:hypothetical protein